jgi:hypothetical protein
MVIKITVANKRPTVDGAPIIVCGNSDYTINFTFDAEWSAQALKTARFVFYKDGATQYQDVAFSGNTVAVPVLSGIREVYVGVYAGDLRTTTPARIPCDKSILCGTGTEHEAPDPDIYNQILAACNELIGVAGNHPNLKNNPHGVTIAQIGAAPAGYGLGMAECAYPPNADANQISANGFWQCYVNCPDSANWYVYREAHIVGTYEHQSAIRVIDGQRAERTMAGGVWQPWEWVSPPMSPTTEYRTTERWNGKAVYAMAFSFGNLPNCSSASVELPNGPWGNTGCIYATAITNNGAFLNCIDSVTDKYVWAKTGSDYSSVSATIHLKYTKD